MKTKLNSINSERAPKRIKRTALALCGALALIGLCGQAMAELLTPRECLLLGMLGVAVPPECGGPTGAPSAPPAAAIVGTWEVAARVGPCGGPFGPPFLAFLVFHAGGTLTDTTMAPLAGIPTPFGQSIRGPAFGTWRYDPPTQSYTAQQRFNWFVDGFYHGYQQISFDHIELTADGSSLSTTISATRNFIDGSPPISSCGELSMVRTP